MPDFLTKAKRSALMASIRGRGNKDTELAFIRILRRFHIVGWRREQRLVGKPDFVFRKARVAVFVDGCFWHGCPKHSRHAAKSGAYWRDKLATNQARDKVATRTLRAQRWRVLRIWEHELAKKNQARLVRRIQKALGSAKLAALLLPAVRGPHRPLTSQHFAQLRRRAGGDSEFRIGHQIPPRGSAGRW
jgi:DNA mismatch endonuclease, patch repair protein